MTSVVWVTKNLSYTAQMKAATQQLWQSIQRGEVPASNFKPLQLKQIEAGQAKIDGLTWHHHQDSGRMQLVDAKRHQETGHIGGDAMQGGK